MIDFGAGAVDLVMLVRLKYIDTAGARQTFRWSSPPARAGSGVSVHDLEGDGRAHHYSGRISEVSDDLDIGGIRNTVQAISDLTIKVALHGAADPLLPVLRDARFHGQPVTVWAFDRLTTKAQPVFDGIADRQWTGITPTAATMKVSDDPVGFTAAWPSIEMPDAEDEIGRAVV